MRIFLATGIYPPQIGGPATQARLLEEFLAKEGCDARVITFGEAPALSPGLSLVSKRGGFFFRYLRYFRTVFKLVRRGDLIYAFDLFSVGLPCALVKLCRPGVRLVIRLGGDFAWERAVNRGYADTLENFYRQKKFTLTETLLRLVSRFVVRRADKIVFNSRFLCDLYLKYGIVDRGRAVVIGNLESTSVPRPFPPKKFDQAHPRLLFAGRIIAVKNLQRLVDAFRQVSGRYPGEMTLEVVGDGPAKAEIQDYVTGRPGPGVISFLPGLSQSKLLEKIALSDLCLLVSLTEVNANFVGEALSLGKPVILTSQSESCYLGQKNALIHCVNPLSVEAIAQAIEFVIKHYPADGLRIDLAARREVEEAYRQLFSCLSA